MQAVDGGPESFARAVLGLDAAPKPPLHNGGGWIGDQRQLVCTYPYLYTLAATLYAFGLCRHCHGQFTPLRRQRARDGQCSCTAREYGLQS